MAVVDEEIPLSGGNTNTGVVRVGDTVRRGISRSSNTVQQLLLHLEAKGFSGSPRFLGLDDKNREILTFVPGETGVEPTIWTTIDPLVETARMLRQYHDATIDLVAVEPHWKFEHPKRSEHEVICHNDFAPYNFVFSGDRPCAILDFDLAGPGPRIWDVAYAAYWMTPLSFNAADMVSFAEADITAGSPRLKLFCKTYYIPPDRALTETVADVLRHMANEKAAQEILGVQAARRLKQGGHFEHWQKEADAFQARLSQLQANLA
ncbi:phosphotransferase [Hoeflea sp.]|uniref:phosphotransferase n=1 Tax=Hoeflea sp. TaxID=1940281 RepID=UPI003B0150EB